jgi:hypothetical protein
MQTKAEIENFEEMKTRSGSILGAPSPGGMTSCPSQPRTEGFPGTQDFWGQLATLVVRSTGLVLPEFGKGRPSAGKSLEEPGGPEDGEAALLLVSQLQKINHRRAGQVG